MKQTAQERERFFVDLYRAEYDSILAYTRRRTDETSARDVTAETFLVAWRRLEEFQARGVPWLYRTAALVLKNAQRSTRRQGVTALRLAREPVLLALDPADGHDRGADLRLALGALSERDRELLLLVAWEQLDIKAAAVVVGCSAPTASVRLHRARRRLRERLDALTREATPPTPVHPRNRDTVPRDREAM